MVALLWGISLGLMLLPLTEVWGQLGYEPLTFSCTIMEKNGSSPMTFLLTFGFLAPFLSIAIGYGFICYKVKNIGDSVMSTYGTSDNDGSHQQRIRHREVRLQFVFLVITFDSHHYAFYWGHQCPWTLTPANSMQVPNNCIRNWKCVAREVLGAWGTIRGQNILVSCFTRTPHGDLV